MRSISVSKMSDAPMLPLVYYRDANQAARDHRLGPRVEKATAVDLKGSVLSVSDDSAVNRARASGALIVVLIGGA
jgi:hypothetical protein